MPTLDIYHGTEDELSFLDISKPKGIKVGDKIVNAPSTTTKEILNGEQTPTEEQKPHPAPYYDVELNYRLDPAEGGTEVLWGGTMHLMRRKWKTTTVRTHNARGKEKEFSLDTTGFQFEHFPSSYKGMPWIPLDEELVREYNPEAEEFMRKLQAAKSTGATDVRLISHLVRQRDWRSDPEEDAKRPDMAMTDGGLLSAHYVHVDQSYDGAVRRLMDDLPPGEWVDHKDKHRWAIVNMWRPLEPVRREFLTLCDARSVREDELHDTMHCVPFHWPKPPTENHMWLVTAPESLEQHKWWFRGGMTRDDVILIKIFDSKKDGRARRAPHCAATTPDCFGPARRSLETRFFLFWEDDTSE